jgi:hypothetical protein
MNRLVAAALIPIASLGLLSACGDSKVATPSSASESVPTTGFLFPDEVTTPPGVTFSGITVPEATIDQMIASFEANGIKVDKACFTALLKDDSMRQLVEASKGGTPSPELVQQFIKCLAA